MRQSTGRYSQTKRRAGTTNRRSIPADRYGVDIIARFTRNARLGSPPGKDRQV